MRELKRIIISRTDSIGDVILTLPAAGMLKKIFPHAELIFLGRSYTRDVIEACEHISRFMNWDELSSQSETQAADALRLANADMIIHVFPRKEIARLAKKAHIPLRLGTTNRLYHWGSCNKLICLSRKKSSLHEAQLNLKLIKSITGIGIVAPEQISELYGLSRTEPLEDQFLHQIDKEKFNLILQPKSKGSAREWGADNFIQLVNILPPVDFKVFISGTEAEGELLRGSGIFDQEGVTNLCGQMSLGQLMSFIKACDGLVAASTGPLHLAAALGITAIGIYPPIKPMHPGRWAPIGKKATYLVKEDDCNDCRKQGACHCMAEISPEHVKELLLNGSN
jgi:ADP-heptose:LPS heptosyltransferase